MTALDWGVIVIYMLCMLGVGRYYALRTRNTEEYLLGGRTVGRTSIGLSLFASLLSSVSYLARPGEMIKHGPMILAEVLAFPLVFVVVGYVLIPRLLQQRVTSAYEILETKLGLGIRLLGSCLFLSLRLIWMGVVIYATTSQILVPLMQIPGWMTPYLSLMMGLVTVAYTSWGGLRAVVITDVMQTVILLSGAILTLLVINYRLGGIAHWWPSEWPRHWDTFQLGLATESRVTILSAVISGLAWWICTAGSDQMAIQRYFATRDVRAARGAFGISLITAAISACLLSLVGVALLAYFHNHGESLPSGVDVDENADRLFPHFIVIALPAGITGLVIAGLVAAAMSSLSSGVNSATSVIAVDFVGRWNLKPKGEVQKLRRNRLISWCVGLVAVVLSTAIGYVEGNLIEISFKAANLLVGPLFLLFFMALFIPWATPFGTTVAAVVSIAVAVGVAYYGLLGLSFIWVLPASLAAGIITGPLISLLPITTRPAT